MPTPEAEAEADVPSEEDAIDFVLPGRVRCASGEGVSRDRGECFPLEGVTVPDLPDNPNLALSPEVFGVEPLGVDDLGTGACDGADDELDDGGRETAAEVFTILFGREGDEVLADAGVGNLGFVGELCGDTLSELVRFALRAARWGRGLIGRSLFSAGEVTAITGLFCDSFFSSSDVLRRRRVLVRTSAGEGGFAECSTNTDFGRYFGSADADVAFALLGRSVETLPLSVTGCGDMASAVLLLGAADCSSEEPAAGRECEAETRLRVAGFASGVAVRCEGGFESPIEFLGGAGCAGNIWRELFRLDAVSFVFFVFLRSLPASDLLASGAKPKALPTDARLSDCRRELRVGFILGLSADIVRITDER